jgi:ABC-type multidrug transport system ATPase subunit
VQTVARKHKVGTVPVKVLDGVSGVLRPGRLTLLMGPPGSGKSVFLKVRFRNRPRL